MKKSDLPRLIKLSLFGVVAVVLALQVGLAWVYVSSLISPGCGAPFHAPGAVNHNILSSDGLELDIWVYPSHNGAVVIALGGIGGSQGQLPPVDFLLEAGYGVIQVESRACASPPGFVTLGHLEAIDTTSIVQSIMQNNIMNANKIGIMGFSMGGVAAIEAAAHNPEIIAVAAEGGYYNFGWDIVEVSSSPLDQFVQYPIAGVFWLRTGINPWEMSPLEELR